MSEQFLPSNEWPLQQEYKYQLHRRIQRWGDFVAPIFENLEGDDKTKKEQLFQWLMECVERDDRVVAGLIDTLDIGVREKYVYGDAFDAIREDRNNPEHNPSFAPTIQNQFLALSRIYDSGSEMSAH